MSLKWFSRLDFGNQTSGINTRYYHGFRGEDFVGQITDLASKRHKSKWEESLIRRFYMEAFHAPLEDDISSD